LLLSTQNGPFIDLMKRPFTALVSGAEDGTRTHKPLRAAVFKGDFKPGHNKSHADLPHSDAEKEQ
jgi:hypothetical protein